MFCYSEKEVDDAGAGLAEESGAEESSGIKRIEVERQKVSEEEELVRHSEHII